MTDIRVEESGSVIVIPKEQWETKPTYIKKIKIEERIPISGIPNTHKYH